MYHHVIEKGAISPFTLTWKMFGRSNCGQDQTSENFTIRRNESIRTFKYPEFSAWFNINFSYIWIVTFNACARVSGSVFQRFSPHWRWIIYPKRLCSKTVQNHFWHFLIFFSYQSYPITFSSVTHLQGTFLSPFIINSRINEGKNCSAPAF